MDRPDITSAPPLLINSQLEPEKFCLLSERDLKNLRVALREILEHCDEFVDRWYRLYSTHFGGTETLSEAEFRQIFQSCIPGNKAALIEGDFERYTREVERLSEMMAARGMPLDEVIINTRLLEEVERSMFPHDLLASEPALKTLQKLTYTRVMIEVHTYSTFHSKADCREIRAELPVDESGTCHLIGRSPVMTQMYEKIEAASRTRGTVLIVGESGTGKELAARAIHDSGKGSGAPYVAFNCAAIPRELIESELFGYKKGAFSGATADYPGLFRAADKGTLFLDEVTEMGPETQSKLLRALQEHTVRPVGSTREYAVDVRIIASTNRDPEEAVESGQLRRDLYYRLQANVIWVPALREHIDDVPVLAGHFIQMFNAELDGRIPVQGIEHSALEAMLRYEWPGNVRELSNAIESAFTFGHHPLIQIEDLPPAIQGHRESVLSLSSERRSAETPSFAETEKELIIRALTASGGNKLQASRLLQISRKRLYSKIRKYGL